MSKQDLLEIAEIAKIFQTSNSQATAKSFSDNLMRGGMAVCVAALLWTGTSINRLTAQQAANTVRWESVEKDLKHLNALSDIPRFTREDFSANVLPMVQRLEINTENIEDNRNSIKLVYNKVIALENNRKGEKE